MNIVVWYVEKKYFEVKMLVTNGNNRDENEIICKLR